MNQTRRYLANKFHGLLTQPVAGMKETNRGFIGKFLDFKSTAHEICEPSHGQAPPSRAR